MVYSSAYEWSKGNFRMFKERGIDTIFGYPGGAVIPLYDALYDYSDDFKHIRTSHEQGLVHLCRWVRKKY